MYVPLTVLFFTKVSSLSCMVCMHFSWSDFRFIVVVVVAVVIATAAVAAAAATSQQHA